MEHSEQQLADTLTDEPIVFMGCTGTEIMLVIGLSAALCVPIGLIVGIILISLSPSVALLGGVIIAFGGSFAVALVALNRLQSTKEQDGSDHDTETIALTRTRWGMGEPAITRSQRYSRGRSL